MNNLIFYFDGLPQNLDDFNGTQSASFVFRRKTENGESAFSFAPELTLTGAAYDYVRQQIINAPNPKIAAIEVLVYDTCCLNSDGSNRLLFTGKIEGGSVRWCTFPTCEAQVTIVDNSQDANAIRCLKDHFPWDVINKDNNINTLGIDEFRYAPWIYYCNDPKPAALQEAIMVIGIFIFLVTAPLLFIFQLFNLLEGYDQNLFTDLSNLIVGCKNRHITPFLDSQFKNLCKLCNIGYQSSLFNVGGFYHNTVRMDAAYVPGTKADPFFTFGQNVYEENRPNLNGIQFLDALKEFNIEWRVINGVLQIERKDYFSGVQWFDTDNLQPNQLLSICYESLGERPASYAEYQYSLDGVDNSGDEVRRKWVDRVIDWNTTNNPQQSGLFSKKLLYGAAQFRDDWAAPDVNPIDKSFYTTFYPFAQTNYNKWAMFISKGVLTYPKLINIQTIIGQDLTYNDFVRGFAIPDLISMSNGKFLFNYRWHIRENPIVDINGTSYDTAYQKLFYIDDPRLTTVKTRKVTISVTANCYLLNTLDVDKYITTPEGQIEIQEITYDTNNNSLTISGLI
jgi:hypothetical protein